MTSRRIVLRIAYVVSEQDENLVSSNIRQKGPANIGLAEGGDMAVNKCGEEVPAEVAELALQKGCAGGVLYVYRDGHYGKGRPVASIGGDRGAQLRRDDYNYYKVRLADSWVAFRSPTRVYDQRPRAKG